MRILTFYTVVLNKITVFVLPFYLILHTCFGYMLCLCTVYMPGAHQGHKKGLYSPTAPNWSYRWLLLSIMSGLQTEPRSSTRAATVLNLWASLQHLCFLDRTLWLKTTKQQLELSQAFIKSTHHFRKSCVHVGIHMCAFLWMWAFNGYRGQRVTCDWSSPSPLGQGFVFLPLSMPGKLVCELPGLF